VSTIIFFVNFYAGDVTTLLTIVFAQLSQKWLNSNVVGVIDLQKTVYGSICELLFDVEYVWIMRYVGEYSRQKVVSFRLGELPLHR